MIALRGEQRLNEAMAEHTSWRVGGKVRCWYRPADLDDLANFLRGLPANEPLYWVGLGSNLLVRDGGIDGTVISTHGGLGLLERVGEDDVRVGAGVACAKLAKQCARWQLSGLDFFAGIPGTVGGALAMNAGAFGGETWANVKEVELIDRTGQLHRRAATEFQVNYRHVVPPKADEWYVSALFQLTMNNGGELVSNTRKLLAKRSATQPTGVMSCGSVFRNPPGGYAAQLIESCGLKGRRIGGAEVSTKHANFIINDGKATAMDIESLILLVREEVSRRCGVELQPEVCIVGNPV